MNETAYAVIKHKSRPVTGGFYVFGHFLDEEISFMN